MVVSGLKGPSTDMIRDLGFYVRNYGYGLGQILLICGPCGEFLYSVYKASVRLPPLATPLRRVAGMSR